MAKIKIDCEVCEGTGKVKLGEGLHTEICRNCEGGEIELTKLQIEIVNEYLKKRAGGFTHSEALVIVTQDQVKEKGLKGSFAYDRIFNEISRIIYSMSIVEMEEIRQFIEERLSQ